MQYKIRLEHKNIDRIFIRQSSNGSYWTLHFTHTVHTHTDTQTYAHCCFKTDSKAPNKELPFRVIVVALSIQLYSKAFDFIVTQKNDVITRQVCCIMKSQSINIVLLQ